MHVYLIKASAPGPFKAYKKAMGAPPQNIFSVAAATPEGVTIDMCDETIGMTPNLKTRADIVALFFHTPDAVHAYTLADGYRNRGKTVVLGGLHPSAEPEESGAHADAVLIGEAEGIWEELLTDYADENIGLKTRYKRDRPVDLAHVKPYPTHIIPPAKYTHIWSVLVSRGCVHRCDFCGVPPFFCGKYTKRPIQHIVDEIKAAPTDWFELHADNLTADRAYALELFQALKPLKINWYGESTIKMADDGELLKAAAESGCKELLIGIETPSQSALKSSGKGFVKPADIREKIGRFHDHGIRIISSMIFGFDTHTPGIFEESEAFCRYIELDEVEPVLLIPFAGTPLYDRLKSENRILTRDWSKYDGSHAVFRPAHMTPRELEEGAERFWKQIRKKKAVDPKWIHRFEGGGDGPGGTNTAHKGRRGPDLTTGGSRTRWKSVVALVFIVIGIFMNWHWIWGVLAVIWGITDLRSGQTFLLDEIPRSQAPLLYGSVVCMWLVLGVWTFLAYFG